MIPARYKKPLLIAAAFMIIVLGLYLYRSLQFRVIGTTPDHRNYPALLGTMEVEFNQALDQQALKKRIAKDTGSVVSVGFESQVIVTVGEKKLTLIFGQTPKVGSYEISLKDIPSADGDRLTTTLPLRVKDIAYEKMSKEERKLFDQLASNDGDNETSEFPILQKLPYQTENYLIDYDFPHGDPVPTLVITMRFFPPGNNAQPATPAEQQAYLDAIRKYRQEALAWIIGQKVSLDDYFLQYTEAELQGEFPQGRGKYYGAEEQDTRTAPVDERGELYRGP